jgi:hypothetical protein
MRKRGAEGEEPVEQELREGNSTCVRRAASKATGIIYSTPRTRLLSRLFELDLPINDNIVHFAGSFKASCFLASPNPTDHPSETRVPAYSPSYAPSSISFIMRSAFGNFPNRYGSKGKTRLRGSLLQWTADELGSSQPAPRNMHTGS